MELFNLSDITEVYTDGGVIKKNPSTFGGMWAWVGVNSSGEVVDKGSGLVVPEENGQAITNNLTEQLAIVHALEALPSGWIGKLCSDSQIALGRTLEGWRNKNLPEQVVVRTRSAVARLGKITGELVSGHPTKAQLALGIGKGGRRVSVFNVMCDETCTEIGKAYYKQLRPEAGDKI